VGVDGIQKSLQSFADEHPDLQLEPIHPNDDDDDNAATTIIAGTKKFQMMTGQNITLLKGDFFDLADDSERMGVLLGEEKQFLFSAIYDRAALVAIQPPMRELYLDIMQHVLIPGGKILLVTVEHDHGSGPPFSILEQDVQSLYGTRPDWIESITVLNPNETQTDANGRISRWYLIQSKASL
jgi:thiopurine S-methyltransferase